MRSASNLACIITYQISHNWWFTIFLMPLMSLLPGNSDFCDCGKEVEASELQSYNETALCWGMLIRDKQTSDLWWIFTGTDMPEACVRICERSTQTKGFCSDSDTHLSLKGLKKRWAFITEVRILWTCWIAWAVHSTAVKSKEKFTSIPSIVHEQVMREEKEEKFQCYPDIYTGGKMWLCSAGVKKIDNTKDNFKLAKSRRRRAIWALCYREQHKVPLNSHVISQAD